MNTFSYKMNSDLCMLPRSESCICRCNDIHSCLCMHAHVCVGVCVWGCVCVCVCLAYFSRIEKRWSWLFTSNRPWLSYCEEHNIFSRARCYKRVDDTPQNCSIESSLLSVRELQLTWCSVTLTYRAQKHHQQRCLVCLSVVDHRWATVLPPKGRLSCTHSV